MFPEAEKVKEACQVEKKKKGQGESSGNRMNKSSQSPVNGEGQRRGWTNRRKADYDSSKKSEGETQEGCQDGKLQLSSESDRVFLLSLKWCI